MKAAQLLHDTRRFLEQGFVADGPALAIGDRKVQARSIEAIKWSLFGALAAAGYPFSPPWDQAVAMLAKEAGNLSPVELLDWSEAPVRVREEVFSLIDRTLEKMKGMG